MKKYLFNIAIALDQLVNTILLGDPDETMSSRMGKHLVKHDNCPFCNWLCGLLNKIQPNHCVRSIEEDEGNDSIKF
jgi:hypothetical protein